MHRNEIVDLFDHLVSPVEQRCWDLKAEAPRGLEIDDKLELRRLLNRQVGRLCAFEEFVNISRGAAREVGEAWPIAHQSTRVHMQPVGMHRRNKTYDVEGPSKENGVLPS